MLNVVYALQDTALAQEVMSRLSGKYQFQDLRQAGVSPEAGCLLLLIYSNDTLKDTAARNHVYWTFDHNQNVLIVTRGQVKLPHILDHLTPVDLNADPQLAAVRAQIDYLTGDDAPKPMRVLTPSVRKANWAVASVFILLATAMFCIGLVAIGGRVVRPPEAEYNAVETAIQGTIDIEIQTELNQYMNFLPRSTEDAANYAATLQQVPTRYRPFMAETATGAAQQTLSPMTAVPDFATAEATPAS